MHLKTRLIILHCKKKPWNIMKYYLFFKMFMKGVENVKLQK